MPAVEVGRICVKVAGRESGRKCVVVDVMDKSFVLITGPKSVTGVKRKRANVGHIMVLEDKLEIKKNASDEEISTKLEETGKLEEMKQAVKGLRP